MKYFTLVMAAIMTASTASAAHWASKERNLNTPNKVTTVHKNAANQLSLNHKTLDVSKLSTVPTVASRAASLPIYEAEGTNVRYEVEGLGYQNTWFGLYFEPSSSMKDIVYGEGTDVYIKNIVPIGEDYYVKGTCADSKITVDFPQTVYYYSDGVEEQCLSLNVLEYDEDAQYMYKNAPADKCQVVMDVAEDGSISWTLNEGYTYDNFLEADELPLYILGLTESVEEGVTDWFGYGDCLQDYTIFTLETITPPADAVYETWVMAYDNLNESRDALYVPVAIAGDEIYVGDLNEEAPGWVKGTIADGKAYFESGQYICYNDLYSLNIYFLTGTFEEVYYEEYDAWDFHVEFSEGITFTYDAEAKKLTAEDPTSCIVLNAKLDDLLYLEICINPEIKWQDPALCNASPNNPICLNYTPWDPDFYGGQGSIIWDIPATNVNGALLDTNRMYYHFLVDGEVYPIDPEEYPYVDEYMVDIPYNYSEGSDIWAMGEEHDIYFYFDGAESFGLQSFYVGDDGVTYESEIVTYVPETEGIEGVKAIEVLSTKYIDLMGREVTNPQNGLYIKAMKLADGSTRSVKVMVK